MKTGKKSTINFSIFSKVLTIKYSASKVNYICIKRLFKTFRVFYMHININFQNTTSLKNHKCIPITYTIDSRL